MKLRGASIAFALAASACGRLGFDTVDTVAAIDDASARTDVTVSMVDGANLVCASRTALGVPESGMINGDFGTLTNDANSTCGGNNVNDQLYAIDIVTGAALLAAADLGAGNDSVVHIRTTCDQPTTEIACDADGGRGGNGAWRTPALAAGRYWVFVDNSVLGSDTYEGTINALLPVGAACMPTNARDRCGPDLECVNQQCVAATCVGALDAGSPPIDVTLTISGEPNRHAAAISCSQGNDDGVRASERVVRVTLAAAVTNLHITTLNAGTDYDSLIYMRDGCLGAQIGCSDDDSGAAGGESTFDTGPLGAGTYFIFVDGFAGRTGTAQLTVTAT